MTLLGILYHKMFSNLNSHLFPKVFIELADK